MGGREVRHHKLCQSDGLDWYCNPYKERPLMEKYGVELDQEKVKTASTKETCPECGANLPTLTNDCKYCYNCGTKPFEKRKNDGEGQE